MRKCVIPKREDYGRLDVAVGGGPSRIELAQQGETALVRVRGSLDAELAPALRDALGWAVDHHAGVVIDLDGVPALDQGGLAVLVRAQTRAEGRGIGLCYAAPSGALAVVLHAVAAGGSAAVFDDCSSALSWLRA